MNKNYVCNKLANMSIQFTVYVVLLSFCVWRSMHILLSQLWCSFHTQNQQNYGAHLKPQLRVPHDDKFKLIWCSQSHWGLLKTTAIFFFFWLEGNRPNLKSRDILSDFHKCINTLVRGSTGSEAELYANKKRWVLQWAWKGMHTVFKGAIRKALTLSHCKDGSIVLHRDREHSYSTYTQNCHYYGIDDMHLLKNVTNSLSSGGDFD